DVSWVLPLYSRLKYQTSTSSDFVSHDLSVDTVFEGRQCDPSNLPSYQLELILRKWSPIDGSREFRCFVCEGSILAQVRR
ncbi:hypothetical protein DFJ58DRAFT_667006, partial [Suillus subalutaceus]|uniref:uncharacterized protein n=1 Tax=Suillus subalutaceus TaxID=48586 RepID=UPI001B884818